MAFDSFLDFFYNISVVEAVAGIAFFLFLYYYWQYRDVPPGPRGIPLLGYWPFFKLENSHLQMDEIRKKYGKINSFNVTGQLYINLCSIKLIKEAHISKSDCFMDRFTGFSLLTLSFEDAVSIINGESWRVQRKFYQQKFREYGMLAIKENFAGSVYDTLKETIEEIRAKEGDPFSIADLLTVKCASIIKRILFNDQGITEDELKELNHEYLTVITTMTYKNLLLAGNIAKYMVFPFMPTYWAMRRSHNRIQEILRNVVQRHKDNFDETQIMDIIDCYFKEKKDRESKGDPTAKYFTDKSLISSVYQFLTDGVLTIAFFIATILEKLVQYPEEQEKVYQELLDVLGPDRQPTMEERNNLPYTNAFICEVLRRGESFPLFPSLKCTKETSIQGYRIPKGAVTVLNIFCANHDPETYEDPYDFKPSRFISPSGKSKTELPLMFGIGKRNCMGEPLTMMETFLFVATIVKNFRLTTPRQTSSSILNAGEVSISAHPRT